MGDALRNVAFGMTIVFCAAIVALLSFTSLELSVAVFTVGSLIYIITSESKRRNAWEKAADFKFMLMHKKHDALATTVKQKLEADKAAPKVKNDVTAETKAEARRKADALRNAAANSNKEAVSFHSLVGNAPQAPANEGKIGPLSKAKIAAKQSALPSHSITQKKAQSVNVIEDADSLSDLVIEELTGHALKNKGIDVFMQPILRLPQRQRKFYEVFSRLRAKQGVYIPAGRFMDVAKKNNQEQDIDALMLEKCLDILKHSADLTDAPSFFINVNANTLRSGRFMYLLLPFLAKNRSLAGRLVFEMRQSEFHDLGLPALKIMSGLAKLGCAFSLDHVTSLDEDIADLQRFRVRFLKADAALFVEAAKDERRYKAIMKSKRTLEGNGIGLIVEKIENATIMRTLLDYDLHYGQGYYFGRPDLRGAYEPTLKTAKIA
ncbi:MAG: EAL domain-containing protein [Alphaproteobacteria bacterium]|nr:EAL domain-containing protein [Alphaproteobacteria bacterium]